MIILNVFGQRLIVQKTVIVSGTVNYLEFMLKASGDWKKATHIYFHASKGTDNYIAEFDENDIAQMDLSDGIWNIWLHGDKIVEDEVIYRITTGVYQINVDRTGTTTGDYLPTIPATMSEILSSRIDAGITQFQNYAHNAEVNAASAKDYAQTAKAQAELAKTSATNAETSASSAATSASNAMASISTMQAQVAQVIEYADNAEASAEEASQSASAAATSASSATTVANSAKTKANEAIAKAIEASEKADNAKAEGSRAYQKALLAFDEAEDLFEVCEGHETRISALEAGGSGTSYDDTELRNRISVIEGKESGWDAKSNFSGSYDDLSNKPTIPTVPISEINANTLARHSHSNKTVLDGITSDKISSWDSKSTFSGNYNDLSNKPTIPEAVTETTISNWGFAKSSDVPEAVTDSHINDLIDAKISGLEAQSARILTAIGDEAT